jgi:hypothetical protein
MTEHILEIKQSCAVEKTRIIMEATVKITPIPVSKAFIPKTWINPGSIGTC